MKQIETAFRDGHNRYSFVLPRRGGARFNRHHRSSKLREFRRPVGIVTFTDISEQRLAEEELLTASAGLQKRQMEIEEDLRLAAQVRKRILPCGLDLSSHPDLVAEFTVRLQDSRVGAPSFADFDLLKDIETIFAAASVAAFGHAFRCLVSL